MEFSDKSCSGLQIGELLSLWGSQQRTSREVKVLTERHIGELETIKRGLSPIVRVRVR